jgi:hypothetical protein
MPVRQRVCCFVCDRADRLLVAVSPIHFRDDLAVRLLVAIHGRGPGGFLFPSSGPRPKSCHAYVFVVIFVATFEYTVLIACANAFIEATAASATRTMSKAYSVKS